MPRRSARSLAAVLGTVALAGLARPAAAQFTVTFTQVGNDVVANGAGSFNLTGLTLLGATRGSPGVNGGFAEVFVGAPGGVAVYGGATALPTFGTNTTTPASTGTGPSIGYLSPASPGTPMIAVPVGYISGTVIADQDLFANQTFATLGLTQGTYTSTWNSGQGSFTVQVGPAAVTAPEPATWALLGTGLLAVGGVARRRRPS